METLMVDRADGIVTVTLNRPAKKNAISGAMWRELRAVIDEVASQRSDRVLLFTGAGDGFCSGQDLMDAENGERFRGPGGALQSMREIGAVALAVHECPKPTIAAVNGVAAGAGANLAFGCDLILAAESARFSQIFAKRGLSIDFGGSWLLPRLIGLHKAKELAFFADTITAEHADALGLVNRVVPDGELLAVAHEWAARLAAGPPLALSAIKRALNTGVNAPFDQVLEAEALAQAAMYSTADVAEAYAAFAEKRDPTFTGE